MPKIYTSCAGNEYETLPDGRTFSFMDFIDGDEPTNFTRPMIEALATAVAKMNVLGQTFTFLAPRSWQGTIVELAQERLEEYRSKGKRDKFVEYLANRLQKQLAQTNLATLPFGPVHGDIMHQNIKFKGEHLNGIFDFDDCRESYLIEDITKTLYFAIEDPIHCVLGDDITNAKVFIDAYEKVRPLSEQEKVSLPTLSLSRFTYELLKFHLHGAMNPKAAENLAAKEVAYHRFRELFEA